MFHFTRLVVLLTLNAVGLSSCGRDASRSHRVSPALEEKSPKLLIGRYSSNDLASENLKVEFVAVSDSVDITNGADAERAFAQGKPVHFTSSNKGSGSDSITYAMAMNQQAGVACPPGMVCSPDQFVVGGPQVGLFGGLLQGFLSRIKNLFSLFLPSTWLGDNGMNYNYQNQFGSGYNQYGVFVPAPQAPIYQPVPIQTYPGGPTNGGMQYIPYPNSLPPGAQYPGQSTGQLPGQPYGQYPGQPQVQYPNQPNGPFPGQPYGQYPNQPQQPGGQRPSGREPMPAALR
jgi:hypothetical protein